MSAPNQVGGFWRAARRLVARQPVAVAAVATLLVAGTVAVVVTRQREPTCSSLADVPPAATPLDDELGARFEEWTAEVEAGTVEVAAGGDPVTIDYVAIEPGGEGFDGIEDSDRFEDDVVPWDLTALPGGRVVSAGDGGLITIWDPDRLDARPLAYAGHDSYVRTLAVLDDGRIASGDARGELHLWHPDGGGTPIVVRCPGHTVAATADLGGGTLVVAGPLGSVSDPGAIAVIDTGGPTLDTVHYSEVSYWPEWLAPRADGRLVLHGYDRAAGRHRALGRDRIVVWDPIDGSSDPLGPERFVVPPGHDPLDGLLATASLSDGHIAAGGDGLVWILDPDAPDEPAVTLAGETGLTRAIVELPGGLIAAGLDRTIHVWDRDGTELAVLAGHTHFIRSLATFDDGRLVSTTGYGSVRVWDLAPLIGR